MGLFNFQNGGNTPLFLGPMYQRRGNLPWFPRGGRGDQQEKETTPSLKGFGDYKAFWSDRLLVEGDLGAGQKLINEAVAKSTNKHYLASSLEVKKGTELMNKAFLEKQNIEQIYANYEKHILPKITGKGHLVHTHARGTVGMDLNDVGEFEGIDEVFTARDRVNDFNTPDGQRSLDTQVNTTVDSIDEINKYLINIGFTDVDVIDRVDIYNQDSRQRDRAVALMKVIRYKGTSNFDQLLKIKETLAGSLSEEGKVGYKNNFILTGQENNDRDIVLTPAFKDKNGKIIEEVLQYKKGTLTALHTALRLKPLDEALRKKYKETVEWYVQNVYIPDQVADVIFSKLKTPGLEDDLVVLDTDIGDYNRKMIEKAEASVGYWHTSYLGALKTERDVVETVYISDKHEGGKFAVKGKAEEGKAILRTFQTGIHPPEKVADLFEFLTPIKGVLPTMDNRVPLRGHSLLGGGQFYYEGRWHNGLEFPTADSFIVNVTGNYKLMPKGRTMPDGDSMQWTPIDEILTKPDMINLYSEEKKKHGHKVAMTKIALIYPEIRKDDPLLYDMYYQDENFYPEYQMLLEVDLNIEEYDLEKSAFTDGFLSVYPKTQRDDNIKTKKGKDGKDYRYYTPGFLEKGITINPFKDDEIDDYQAAGLVSGSGNKMILHKAYIPISPEVVNLDSDKQTEGYYDKRMEELRKTQKDLNVLKANTELSKEKHKIKDK